MAVYGLSDYVYEKLSSGRPEAEDNTEAGLKYVIERAIPELLESLTIALLYHQPDKHIDYLLECLDNVDQIGWQNVTWDTFLPPPPERPKFANQRQTLPPIE